LNAPNRCVGAPFGRAQPVDGRRLEQLGERLVAIDGDDLERGVVRGEDLIRHAPPAGRLKQARDLGRDDRDRGGRAYAEEDDTVMGVGREEVHGAERTTSGRGAPYLSRARSTSAVVMSLVWAL
jgi:hypothetical protein